MTADDVGEEFFKLAVEGDVELSEAKRIRTVVRTAARRRGREVIELERAGDVNSGYSSAISHGTFRRSLPRRPRATPM